MCFKVVFVVFCVLKNILCCTKLEDPIPLHYRHGDILDLEFVHLTVLKQVGEIEFKGQICNSTEFVPLLLANIVKDMKRTNLISLTLYDKIDQDQNICSYHVSLQDKKPKQIKLFQLLYDINRSLTSDNPIPRTFHYRMSLSWLYSCFDLVDKADLVETVAETSTIEPIEEKLGNEIQFYCPAKSGLLNSNIQLISKHPVVISDLLFKAGISNTLKMNLEEFDNNTYLSCTTLESSNEFLPYKWAKVQIKPRLEGSVIQPSFAERIYRYNDGDVYEFHCAYDYNGGSVYRIIYYMKLNEDNEILAAASSNEYTWNLTKQFKLTKNDDKSKLMCLAFLCDYDHICVRQILTTVKLELREDNVTANVPSDKCQLPAYPPNGSYQVFNTPNSTPFQISDFWILDITCDPGFGILDGDTRFFCTSGVWSPSRKLPQCIAFCRLHSHPSVTYNCRSRNTGSEYTRPCDEYEPPGMLAIAECRKPDYVSNDDLPVMHCNREGRWSHNPICMPACGEVTPGGVTLINGGEHLKLGELPWHVGIYQKSTSPYKQICGGSIVRRSVIISAAHCFWDDQKPDDQKIRPASDYAVAAGKLYRPWDDPVDNKYAQKANVISINIPSRFRGQTNSYMDDLAVVLVAISFEYKPHIAPVCLNFDVHFDRLQVADGKIGKVAGWGVTSPGGQSSPELKVVDLPIVPYLECYNKSPISFRRYITGDKICAGFKDKATSVCTGDSGGGLVIAGDDRGVTRYYLRGIVSAAPDELISCTANEITAFTHVIRHYEFIKTYLLL